jgi:hypothetical protein
MTDPTHDPQAELDELASAYLDGQASFAEARRVEQDPELLARVEGLRQARDAIRLPDRPVDHERREAAIAAAMIAAGHEPLTAALPLTAPVPTPAVGDLAEVRARRAARRRWLPAVGIAAAIAIAALLVPRLGDDGDRDDPVASKAETFQDRAADSEVAADSADGDDRDRSSTASAEIGAPPPSELTGGTSAGAGATAEPGATAPAPTTPAGDPATTTTSTTGFTTLTTVVAPFVDLGTFEEGDVSTLREAAKAEADSPKAEAAESSAAVDRCLAEMEDPAQLDGATVIYTAIAKVGEETVVALVLQLESGRELRARYLDGCERLIDGATLS